jgi:enoyl-CoA hydratase
MNKSALVEVDVFGSIAILWLNKPDRRNAIDAGVTAALRSALADFEADNSLQVAILAGRGKVFCAGMDLAAFVNGEAAEILHGENRFAGFVAAQRTKPVIAAGHGAALAGGFELMLACDMVVAAQGCKFGLPEALRGLIAGGGGAFRLAKRVPLAIANEILLTGESFDADRALDLGLVNKVVPHDDLIEAALDLARLVARNAPLSVQYSRALTNLAARGDEATFWDISDRYMSKIEASDDAKEGARAFTEKRAAMWSGK